MQLNAWNNAQSLKNQAMTLSSNTQQQSWTQHSVNRCSWEAYQVDTDHDMQLTSIQHFHRFTLQNAEAVCNCWIWKYFWYLPDRKTTKCWELKSPGLSTVIYTIVDAWSVALDWTRQRYTRQPSDKFIKNVIHEQFASCRTSWTVHLAVYWAMNNGLNRTLNRGNKWSIRLRIMHTLCVERGKSPVVTYRTQVCTPVDSWLSQLFAINFSVFSLL